MNLEKLESIINTLAKGDTSVAEKLLSKPGGKKYLESIVLIIVNNLPHVQEEKEYLFIAFLKALNKIEKRIKHQKAGQEILKQIYQ